MAAPTLQAEGSLNVETSGDNAPTVPTHQADDILVLATGIWAPNTANLLAGFVTPSGWTLLDQSVGTDGAVAWFWRRASGSGTTVTVTRPTDEFGGAIDSGTDTCFGARVYVVRGCATSGDPFDEQDMSIAHSSANGGVRAITVSGSERTVIQFLVKMDDFSTAPTISGWTAGTQVESTTGTDHSQGSFRKENVSSSTTADASTVSATAQGWYQFMGISFKPPPSGTNYTKDLTGGLSFSAAITKRANKALTGGLSFSVTITKRANKALAGGITPAGVISKRTNKALAGGLSFSGALQASKLVFKSLAGGLSFSGSLTKQGGKSLSGALSFSGAITKRANKALAGGLSFSGSLAKETRRALAGGLSFSGNLTSVRLFVKALSGGLSFSGALSKQGRKPLAGALSFSGAISKRTNKALAGGLSFSGAVTTIRLFVKALAGGLSFSGSLSRRTGKSLSGGLAPAGALTKRTNRALAGGLSFAGSISKRAGKALAGALSFVGARPVISTRKALAGSIAPSGSISRRISRSFSSVLSFGTSFVGELQVIGQQFEQAFEATLSFVGSVGTAFHRIAGDVLFLISEHGRERWPWRQRPGIRKR